MKSNAPLAVRAISYAALFLIYTALMDKHLPSGFGWAPYHGNRIFNAVEYLRLNGYLSSLGFSIWTSCNDCDLGESSWVGKIYLSASGFALWPYIFLNQFYGSEALFSVGHWVDKLVIFATGAIASELLLNSLQDKKTVLASNFACHWFASITFVLFITAVWSYHMYRAMWNEIWFLFFMVISIVFLLNKRFAAGVFFVVFASFMHPINGLIFGFVCSTFFMLAVNFNEMAVFKSIMPGTITSPKRILILCSCSAIPMILLFILRSLYLSEFHQEATGSSLISRIGIAGNDIHNGGILGMLQFLGGARITTCLSTLQGSISSIELKDKISAFNCILVIMGLTGISIASMLGCVWLVKFDQGSRFILFTVVMIFLINASILQQSFSVHLLGHSYPFALIFSFGIGGLVLKAITMIGSEVLSIMIISPIIIAITLLSIRASMLVGIPG